MSTLVCTRCFGCGWSRDRCAEPSAPSVSSPWDRQCSSGPHGVLPNPICAQGCGKEPAAQRRAGEVGGVGWESTQGRVTHRLLSLALIQVKAARGAPGRGLEGAPGPRQVGETTGTRLPGMLLMLQGLCPVRP